MAGGIPGSSTHTYAPIQSPNGPVYATFTSTADFSPQYKSYFQQMPPLEPAFSLEEIHTATDIITELSNK